MSPTLWGRAGLTTIRGVDQRPKRNQANQSGMCGAHCWNGCTTLLWKSLNTGFSCLSLIADQNETSCAAAGFKGFDCFVSNFEVACQEECETWQPARKPMQAELHCEWLPHRSLVRNGRQEIRT
ncbi:hypothetical protein [Rhodococcoides kyotonense]|uniref:Uncharacterized protein n=1 Tax=Rhodococcoides kyotonense TaxID=398843 RepID=A0A239MA81_9NOCA|nr:hypothetical protein [Rhodococcus kyotonensis]SNT38749.1 hypothetical protein SAMN05421642_11690 [Rhodococcus kyotonensis]